MLNRKSLQSANLEIILQVSCRITLSLSPRGIQLLKIPPIELHFWGTLSCTKRSLLPQKPLLKRKTSMHLREAGRKAFLCRSVLNVEMWTMHDCSLSFRNKTKIMRVNSHIKKKLHPSAALIFFSSLRHVVKFQLTSSLLILPNQTQYIVKYICWRCFLFQPESSWEQV